MSISEKLKDPDLPPEEETAIVGAFVRRQKREALGERWTKKLSSEHNVKRSHLRAAGEKSPRQRRRLRWILPAVAAALLFLVLLLPQLQTESESRTEVLATIMADAEITALRGRATNDFEGLQTTFSQQYNTGDYAAAITTGEQLLTDPDVQPQDRFYLGLAYLNADAFAKAATTFEDVLATPPTYRTEATFYLAIAKLEQGQEGSGIALLKSIQPTDGAAWYRKAQQVLSAE